MWCEDVQKSSRYDGELDSGLELADCVRVEFELYSECSNPFTELSAIEDERKGRDKALMLLSHVPAVTFVRTEP